MRDQRKEKPKKKCKRCNNNKGLISKYKIFLCRRCFKEVAPKLGFAKLN